MQTRRRILPGLLLAATLAACGSSTATTGRTADPGPTSNPGTPTSTPAPRAHPTGAGDVVFQVGVLGVYVPPFGPRAALELVPVVTLYGDGLELVVDDRATARGGRPHLVQRHLAETDVQQVLAAADGAGLLGDPVDYGAPTVTDQETTYVLVQAGGAVHRHRAYALAYDGVSTQGLPAPQVHAREALHRFLDAVVPEPLGMAPWVPERVDVYARVIDPAKDDDEPSVAIAAPPGPFADVPGHPRYRCASMAVADAAAVLAAIDADPSVHRLTWDGVTHEVSVRPVLPERQPCDPATGGR